MTLTIAYITGREQPQFPWFCDSLCREIQESDFGLPEILFVDLRLDYEPRLRRMELEKAVAGRFEYRHAPPKPSPWQGRHRMTKEDYFCAANARNTALILSTAANIAFVDDQSVLMPGWLESVLLACKDGEVLSGAYMIVKNMEVRGGELVNWSGFEVDSRWSIAERAHKVPISGGGLYGCTFCLPVAAAEAVNGFDEYCDGLGAEDYDFGIRLARAGCRMFYDRAMMVLIQKGSGSSHPNCSTLERHSSLARRAKKHDDGEWTDHHLLNRLLADSSRTTTLARWCDIREQRRRVSAGLSIKHDLPDRDWVDGQPLAEL